MLRSTGHVAFLIRSRPVIYLGHQRALSSGEQAIPTAIQPLFHYLQDCNWTNTLWAGMDLMHSGGVPWVGTFVLSGVALRLFTAPFHVYAEKLFAKRLHAHNYFNTEVLKKVAASRGKNIVPDGESRRLVIEGEPELTVKANELANITLMNYVKDNKLHSSRIQCLKISTVPFWIFSSFAIRNVISADFAPALHGFLWIEDFLLPDPFYILPISVSVLGFLNLYSQRLVFPTQKTTLNKVYDGLLGAFTMVALLIMMKMPACIPLYWLTVSATGLVQSLVLRHPKMKQLLGIPRMPFDSKTPLRDLFWLRRRQNL